MDPMDPMDTVDLTLSLVPTGSMLHRPGSGESQIINPQAPAH